MSNLPTQQEIFTQALKELDTARNGLSSARDELNSDWAGVETGLTLPPAAGEHRRLARAAIAAAKEQIDIAKSELHNALRVYAPEDDYVLDDPRAEIIDEQGGR
ncbi:hypothetical protein ACWFPY_35065 [Nocardia fluminea]